MNAGDLGEEKISTVASVLADSWVGRGIVDEWWSSLSTSEKRTP